MKAEVKQHNGTPTLFLDDQPVFADIQLIGGLDPNGIAATQDAIRVYAKANVHIYSIESSAGPEWCAPRPGSAARYDFSATAPRLQTILDADPEALFLLRMGFETRFLVDNWWNAMNPDEVGFRVFGRHRFLGFVCLRQVAGGSQNFPERLHRPPARAGCTTG